MKNKVLKFFALFSVLALVLVLSPTLARTSECDDDSYEQTPSEDSSGGSNILLKYVRVTSPNGGEILGRNAEAAIVSVSDTHNVTWDSLSAGVKTVDILYSLDMGDTWHEIVMKHENTGAYNWKLPNINASPVLLRVVGYGEGSQVLGSDLSNSPFMIFNYIAEPEVVSENAAEYQFQFVGVNSVGPVAPGELIEVNAVIKNTGKATWHKDGSYPVHLGTYNPNDRVSDFNHSSWLTNNRPAKMMDSMVVPGEVATFKFTMQAPGTPGTYVESFAPVVENLTWMTDDMVTWELQVI